MGAPNVAVKLRLDRERTLRFDFNALARIEEATGRNMLQPQAFENLSARDVRTFLWAALVHEDEALTTEQVGALLNNMPDVERAVRAIAEAWGSASPKAGKKPPLARPAEPPVR